jgi:hypothetical protein
VASVEAADIDVGTETVDGVSKAASEASSRTTRERIFRPDEAFARGHVGGMEEWWCGS